MDTGVVDVELEDVDDGMLELVPGKNGACSAGPPTPSTPKMVDSWEAVPRRILQPSPEPAWTTDPSAQARTEEEAGQVVRDEQGSC